VVPDVAYRKGKRKLEDAAVLDNILGPYAMCDAVRMGSHAHRLMAFWTSLYPAADLQAVIEKHHSPPRRVQEILGPGRVPPPVMREDRAPLYPRNRVGYPMAALPTIVSYPYSYAFREGEPGSMINSDGTNSQFNSTFQQVSGPGPPAQ
jgi:hypothetical protein